MPRSSYINFIARTIGGNDRNQLVRNACATFLAGFLLLVGATGFVRAYHHEQWQMAGVKLYCILIAWPAWCWVRRAGYGSGRNDEL